MLLYPVCRPGICSCIQYVSQFYVSSRMLLYPVCRPGISSYIQYVSQLYVCTRMLLYPVCTSGLYVCTRMLLYPVCKPGISSCIQYVSPGSARGTTSLGTKISFNSADLQPEYQGKRGRSGIREKERNSWHYPHSSSLSKRNFDSQ